MWINYVRIRRVNSIHKLRKTKTNPKKDPISCSLWTRFFYLHAIILLSTVNYSFLFEEVADYRLASLDKKRDLLSESRLQLTANAKQLNLDRKWTHKRAKWRETTFNFVDAMISKRHVKRKLGQVVQISLQCRKFAVSDSKTLKYLGKIETYHYPNNPLSPDSDQDQFSPNNIHMLPREMVMRINKMIT